MPACSGDAPHEVGRIGVEVRAALHLERSGHPGLMRST